MNKEVQDKITEMIIAESMKDIKTNINATLDEFKTAMEAKIDGVKTAAYADIKKLESYVTTEKPLVANLGTVEAPKKELVHKSFATITKILSSSKRKEKNIMLVGGAGGGKTHLVGSVARALKLNFYPMSVGLQTTKSDLLGFINANGIYMPSPIRLAYENGGVLLLDEFDAAHAGVITILNSLLANGHCSFPDKVVEKHKDFVCLCACNTYGKGGTIDYVGRNRLDAATLDRFIIVDVGYDENLERELTKNEEWVQIINQIRKSIDKYGIKMIVSPRASMDGADLLEGGFAIDEVLEMCIFKGCDNDIKTKILKDIKSLTSSVKGEAVLDVYNIDILVNFDKMTYSVDLNDCKQLGRDGVDFEFSKDFKLALSLPSGYEYTPFVYNDKLYVDYRGGDIYTKNSDYNKREQILNLISEMQKVKFKNPCDDKVRLTVIYDGLKCSVCPNTGEYNAETVVKTRKRRK